VTKVLEPAILAPGRSSHVLEYRPGIDGLRGVAVLSVFIFHLKRSWLGGGFVGVDVFFVVSGFLITSIIYRECLLEKFSVIRFYQRRIARILPAFFGAALATVAAAAILYNPHDGALAGTSLKAAALSLANIMTLLQGNYFEMSPDAQPLLHYWSLSVEEQFYLVFPLCLFLLLRYAPNRVATVLSVLCLISLVGCVVLTRVRPNWAFYLLPTRGWELLSGSLLAIAVEDGKVPAWTQTNKLLPLLGLGLIALSVLFISHGTAFPGFVAIAPVCGTLGLLLPACGSSSTERFLAVPALVWVGRLSYSLYLWHWPIFSLVDYSSFLATESTRVLLKIGLTLSATLLSFYALERPARALLNRPGNARLAFAFLVVATGASVGLGTALRQQKYVDAPLREVRHGGVLLNGAATGKSIILMGDSNASMYGATLRDLCYAGGYKLRVLAVTGKDPLPLKDSENPLWNDCLAVIRHEHPDVLVLACSWRRRLREDRERLRHAVEALTPLVGKLVLLTQPPQPPANADRQSIREGARPPFYEDATVRSERLGLNQYVQSLASRNCVVLDAAKHFIGETGEIEFFDKMGHQLYHDHAHLSGYGAQLVGPDLRKVLSD
jgi:peptidoglycan/LPS O-acetylase OafA/YrhL